MVPCTRQFWITMPLPGELPRPLCGLAPKGAEFQKMQLVKLPPQEVRIAGAAASPQRVGPAALSATVQFTMVRPSQEETAAPVAPSPAQRLPAKRELMI